MRKNQKILQEGFIFNDFIQSGLKGIESWDEKIGQYLKDISQKRVLDLGCGCGSSFILFLKKKRYNPKEVIHLDVNPRIFLKRKFAKGHVLYPSIINLMDYQTRKKLSYEWGDDTKIVANAEKIPLEDRCIDIIHQDMLYEDNPKINTNEVYGEIKRILKRGGLYILGDYFPGFIGDEEKISYDGNFERLDLNFPPRPVYRKIKD